MLSSKSNIFSTIAFKHKKHQNNGKINSILLLKKGDPTKITNHRPIALMQSIAKLYESIIKDRLIKNITLHPAQAIVQKGKSTLHRIQSLNLFSETMKKTKQKHFYFFIDFKKPKLIKIKILKLN
jgi:hypothetical protein